MLLSELISLSRNLTFAFNEFSHVETFPKKKMADGCFVILCGIPASGKSTLAKDLIQKDWKIAGKCVHFIYINYDDFIPENLPVNELTHSAKWKDRRRNIINSIEELLLPTQSTSLENQSLSQNTFVSSWCSCGVNPIIRSSDILHVMVIDDNMFYRSMRYEYYQLARKTSFSFAQIYLHCPVEVALARNAQRSASVNEDTITKMFQRFEKPDPDKFSWERFSVTIDSTSCQSADIWKTISKLLENAAGVPAPPLKASDDLQKAKDRAITEKSIVHRVDQVLRKHISQKLEEMRAKNHPSDILKQEATSLNQRRKMIMEQIKKEPETFTNHLFSDHFNSLCLDVHSEKDSLSKSSVNKTKESDKTTDQCSNVLSSIGYLEHSDERTMDESFFLENFWDIISPEEFGDVVRRVFEQT